MRKRVAKKVSKATHKTTAKRAIKRHFASGGSLRDFWNKHKGKLAVAGLSLPVLAAAYKVFGPKFADVLSNDKHIAAPIYEEEQMGRDSNPDFVLEYEGDGRHPKAEADDDADYAYNLGLQQYRDALLAQRTPKDQADYDDYETLHELGYFDEEGYGRSYQ